MSAVVTLAPRTSAAQTEAKMEIVVNRAALLAELTLAQGITSTKAVAPILMNILIEANDDSLTIIATNLDQSVKTSVPAKVKTPGIVTLPARKFFDYVKLLQAEEIKITALDNGWVQIRSGRSNTKMPGMDRANFPVMPEPGAAPRVKIPVAAMLHMIGQTSYAVCREESRYTLAGALFGVSSDRLMMVATDGHRLAYIEKAEKTAGVEKVISALITKRHSSRIIRLVIGNPLIMKEMAKHVPDVGSYAPVTVLVDERADGVHISYDRMASLLAPYGNPDALKVARDLDAKVEHLLQQAAA
jgi:DNA polymerase-3 subunit beta